MKSQPIYFVSRVADKYGNPFTNPNVYTAYNLGDVALQSRIKNYGNSRQLNLDLTMAWNFMTVQATEMVNRALYNQLVPSFFPLVNNANYND